MSIGIYTAAISSAPKPRDWTNFNIIAPLYAILLKHKYTLKQIHYLIYESNRLNNSKLGHARHNVLVPLRRFWKNDREVANKFREWLEEVM